MQLRNILLNSFLLRVRAFAGTPLARRLVFGLFVVQAVVLVFTTQLGVNPDESNHTEFIQFYAHHSLSPIFSHQQPTYHLGDKTREVDYLYHYTMSLVYRVLPLSDHAKFLVIRLFSVLLGLLCMLVLAAVFRRLKVSEGVITVGLAVMTNLPMVLMMCSAVNNDVLVWLGMALGMLLLLRLWSRPAVLDILWLLLLTMAGGLAKRDLLPVCLIFGLVAVYMIIKHFRMLAGEFRFSWQISVAIVMVLVATGLFAERVGGNIVRYGSVVVSCEQVHGKAPCYVFWANGRARWLASQPPQQVEPIPEFVGHWVYDSFANVADIQTQGWRHQVKPARFLVPVLMGAVIFGMTAGVWYEKRRFRTDKISQQRSYLALLALFYIGVQMVVNFSTYTDVKMYGIALNGRYIIAGLLPLMVLACFYWTQLLRRHPRLLIVLATGLVASTVFGSGLLMMLRNPQLYKG